MSDKTIIQTAVENINVLVKTCRESATDALIRGGFKHLTKKDSFEMDMNLDHFDTIYCHVSFTHKGVNITFKTYSRVLRTQFLKYSEEKDFGSSLITKICTELNSLYWDQ